MKRTLFYTAAILLAFGSAAMAEDQRAVQIAIDPSYAPWEFTGPDGKVQGFEIDLTQDLCRRANLKCDMVPQDWDGMIPALNAGKFDAIIAALSITEDRQKVIDFSHVYAAGPNGWGVMKGSPLEGLAGAGQRINLDKDPAAAKQLIEQWKTQLKGKVVGVQTSTVYAKFLEENFKDIIDIREYKTTEQHDLDLTAGRIDAIFAAVPVLLADKDKPGFQDLVLAGGLLQGGMLGRGVAVGLRKDETDLKDKFNAAIDAATSDGTVKALSEKWFKTDMTPIK